MATAGRPMLCPRCGGLVGSEEEACSSCGLAVRSPGHAAARLRRWWGRAGSATGTLAVLIGIAYVGTLLLQGGLFAVRGGGLLGQLLRGNSPLVLLRCGMVVSDALAAGQYWRLVAAMFLHAGLLHLGFNLYVLLQLGRVAEHYYDASRTFVIFFLSGVLGFAGSAVAGNASVGASGAILGLAGAVLVRARLSGSGLDRAVYSQLMAWVILIFILSFLIRGIDWVAHLVGLLSGAGAGFLLLGEKPALLRLYRILALVCALLTAASWMAAVRFVLLTSG